MLAIIGGHRKVSPFYLLFPRFFSSSLLLNLAIKTFEKMKKTILTIYLIAASLFAQNTKFIVLSNLRIGAPKSDSLLSSFVHFINNTDKFDFVIVAGNLTDKGSDKEFELAKSLLEELQIPYYPLQGYRDVQWAQSGGIKFTDLWDETNFGFTRDSVLFIGLNTTPIWRAEKGHISPETLEWFREEIDNASGIKNIILFSYYNLSETDNFFKLTPILKGKNIGAFLNVKSQTDEELTELPDYRVASFYDSSHFRFSVGELNRDTLTFWNYTDNQNILKTEDFNFAPFVFEGGIDSVYFEPFAVEPLWKKELNASVVAEPLILKDKIIVAQYDGLITCYDTSGNKIWDFDSFGNIASTPAEKDGYLTVATLQGDLYTLNVETGDQFQSIGFDEAITSALLMTDYKGTKELMIPKQTSSKAAVIFGTESGKIHCYDVETLQEYWTNKDASGMIQAKPLEINNKIVYGSWDSYLYCIDAREGWLIWKWRMDKDFRNSPAATEPATDGSFLYLAEPNGNIYKVDLLLGKTIWRRNKYNAWQSIGISQNKRNLFVKSAKDYFHILPASTGSWSIAYELDFGIDKTPTIPLEYEGVVLVATADGVIYRIRNQKHKIILINGKASPFSVKHFYDDVYVSSNIDGTITVFKYDGN